LQLAAFTIFQYFLSVVPTTYIDRSGRKVKTSQVRRELGVPLWPHLLIRFPS
jgi:hypothetical protein